VQFDPQCPARLREFTHHRRRPPGQVVPTVNDLAGATAFDAILVGAVEDERVGPGNRLEEAVHLVEAPVGDCTYFEAEVHLGKGLGAHHATAAASRK
jgi:hypothetical protein